MYLNGKKTLEGLLACRSLCVYSHIQPPISVSDRCYAITFAQGAVFLASDRASGQAGSGRKRNIRVSTGSVIRCYRAACWAPEKASQHQE